jgi:hypothetical protein
LDSDVTTWWYAWKLFKATQTQGYAVTQGVLINITVVDDSDTIVNYYATGKPEIFIPNLDKPEPKNFLILLPK